VAFGILFPWSSWTVGWKSIVLRSVFIAVPLLSPLHHLC